MIPVSNGWVDAHKQTLLPEMFVEISYNVTEPGLQEDAIATSESEAGFSNTNQVVAVDDKQGEKYATLEHGAWGLDGEYSYFDGSPENPGFVSETLSGEDGGFSAYPTISIDFAQQRSLLIPGLIIAWSPTFREWATEFRVAAYNAGNLVNQIIVKNNTSALSVVLLDMQKYNKIVIEIRKWCLPYHRARCIDVYLGAKKVYTKDDLISFEHSQTADLLSATLPINTVTFNLRNDDNRWNPDSVTGTERYLAERQEIQIRYGMDVGGAVEWIKGGTFWLSEWSTPSNGLEVSFTARDALEFMEDIYVGVQSGTLREIALSALEQASLTLLEDGSPRYVIDESLDALTVDFSEENGYTIAEVLQMISHAGGCVFYQDREGVIRIEPWKSTYGGYMIEPHVSYNHPEYKMSKPLKSISVGYGEDQREILAVGSVGVVQTIDNPLIRTREDAVRVAERAKEILSNRREISGEYRADVRLDVLDNVVVSSKYASNIIGITNIRYSTSGGSFRGYYTGRVVSIALKPEDRRSGEFYVGEV